MARRRRKGEISDADWARWEYELIAAGREGRILGCYHGFNCSNRDTRDVRVYVLFGDAWRKVPFLEMASITGDIFVSYVPGKYRPQGQELNALVVDLYDGNKECPTRAAPSASAAMYEARTCVVRWNGTKFTYKPL